MCACRKIHVNIGSMKCRVSAHMGLWEIFILKMMIQQFDPSTVKHIRVMQTSANDTMVSQVELENMVCTNLCNFGSLFC